MSGEERFVSWRTLRKRHRQLIDIARRKPHLGGMAVAMLEPVIARHASSLTRDGIDVDAFQWDALLDFIREDGPQVKSSAAAALMRKEAAASVALDKDPEGGTRSWLDYCISLRDPENWHSLIAEAVPKGRKAVLVEEVRKYHARIEITPAGRAWLHLWDGEVKMTPVPYPTIQLATRDAAAWFKEKLV